MNVLICPDKFKGCLQAGKVVGALARGLSSTNPSINCIHYPIADGGGGTLDILHALWPTSRLISVQNVLDPAGRPRSARYLVYEQSAYIELVEGSGIELVQDLKPKALSANTYGTGQLLLHALNHGYTHIYLMLGGSASTDMGTGILSALGVLFYDQTGTSLPDLNGNQLKNISRYDKSALEEFSSLQLDILCDVKNPLYGPHGAAHIYGPQKGASIKEIEILDHGLKHFSNIIQMNTDQDVSSFSGSGAAGGIAAGLSGFFNIRIVPGAYQISEWLSLETEIKNADIIITGEGRFDDQSFNGKIISQIIDLCQKHNKPIYIVCGSSSLLNPPKGVSQIHTILEHSISLEDAIHSAEDKLVLIGQQISKEIKPGSLSMI